MNWKTGLLTITPSRARPWFERLMDSTLGQRLARGAFWSVLGGVAARGFGLVGAILVARILGKQSFGDLGTVQMTVVMFSLVAGAGLGLTATKHVAEFRTKDPVRAGRILRLSNDVALGASLLVALILFGAAKWLAAAVAAPHLESVLRVSALFLFLTGVSGAQLGALAGLEAFRAVARLNLLTGVVSFAAQVMLTWWAGLEGCVWAMSVTAAVGCVANFLALRAELGRAGIVKGQRWQRADLPVLWRFALPSALAVLIVGPVHWVCCAILMNEPDGRAEMGAFNGANQWFTALMVLPALLGQSVLPVMAEQLGASGRQQGRRLLRLSIGMNALTALPVLVLCLASPWIMAWFGRGFEHEWPTLVVALVTATLVAVQIPVGQMIIASGNVWPGFWMNVGWGLVFVGGTWLLAGWGALGLATARLVAYTVHAVWTLWYALRLLRDTRS